MLLAGEILVAEGEAGTPDQGVAEPGVGVETDRQFVGRCGRGAWRRDCTVAGRRSGADRVGYLIHRRDVSDGGQARVLKGDEAMSLAEDGLAVMVALVPPLGTGAVQMLISVPSAAVKWVTSTNGRPASR